MSYDVVIRDGTVIDGTGAPGFRGDVAITGDRIVEVGAVAERGRAEIDATGHVVAPGFIDVHTHLDAQLFWEPLGTTPAWHGVTSVIMGNCGFTLAPCSVEHADLAIRSIERAEDISRRAIEIGVPWSWTTYRDYLGAVAALPKGVNVGGYVGHSALRVHAMGERAYEQRDATGEDLEVMRRALLDGLSAGAVGFSTSRTGHHLTREGGPVASRVAPWAEVAALVDAMAGFGRGVFQLAPEYSSDRDCAAFRHQLRSLAVGSGVTTSFAIGGELALLADAAEIAQAGGRLVGQTNVRVTSNVLNFQTTTPFERLPLWSSFKVLDPTTKRDWLRDPGQRSALVDEAASATFAPTVGAEARPPDYDRMTVLDAVEGPHRSVAEVARERGVHPVAAMVDLALETDLAQCFVQPLSAISDADVEEAMRHEHTVIAGSDAGAHVSQIMDGAIPTYLLSHWVRRNQTFTWERAVHKLTGEPAAIWGLSGRGRLCPGYHADVVVFDPASVAPDLPQVSYDLPDGGPRLTQQATGIRTTLVNGRVFLDEGRFTDVRAGQMLVGGGTRPAR